MYIWYIFSALGHISLNRMTIAPVENTFSLLRVDDDYKVLRDEFYSAQIA